MGFQPFIKEGEPGAFTVRDTRTNEIVFAHKWAKVAVDEANYRNLGEGACPTCFGKGSVVTDWYPTLEGEMRMSTNCPICGGSGKALKEDE